jgi:predicted ester cyclase
MSSTESSNAETARLLHTEVWDGNLDLVDEIIAADYVEHSSTHPEGVHGPDEFKREVETLRSAFSDLSVTEEDTVVEGDRVASRVTFRGTHDGEFRGIEPTGTPVAFEAIAINRFEDGRIVEAWVQTDVMGLMRQLGVVEPPGE